MSSVKEIVKKMRERVTLLALARAEARRDEAQYVRSPEECKKRVTELDVEIAELEISLSPPEVTVSQGAPAGIAPPSWAKPEWVEWTYDKTTGEFVPPVAPDGKP